MPPCQIYQATAQQFKNTLETISFPYIWRKVQLPLKYGKVVRGARYFRNE